MENTFTPDSLVTNNPFTKKLHKYPYQMCTESVMDTSDIDITFDENGVCNHVLDYRNYINALPDSKTRNDLLWEMVDMLKKEGKGKEYDCIMGLSGGVDSSYLSYFVTKVLELRPLVVHVDSGWNSELAVSNIQNIVQKLKIDLHTLVIDWDEIKDIQLAFLRASIANLDVPQDHVFIASLYQEAEKYGIKYILNGGNMATESILPKAWGYDASDPKHLLSIHKQFGKNKLKTYPIFTNYKKLFYYPFVKRMKTLRPLELINYNKFEAKELLKNELGWRDYGGKHYESIFTKFFQAHYLPTKFGYDKRKAHLSSLIVSGQMTREEAILELKQPLYDENDLANDKLYFTKKLGISLDEFESLMRKEPVTYKDFPNSEKLYADIKKTLNYFPQFKKMLIKK